MSSGKSLISGEGYRGDLVVVGVVMSFLVSFLILFTYYTIGFKTFPLRSAL
jgi:hypothetical protein